MTKNCFVEMGIYPPTSPLPLCMTEGSMSLICKDYCPGDNLPPMQPLFLRTHKQAQLTPGHVTTDLMTVSLSSERYIDVKPLLGHYWGGSIKFFFCIY